MGGGGSTSERAEKEKREAASAKRREIKEKDVKERLALMRGYVSDFFRRAEEEEREAASATRREIREKEIKEHNALMEKHLLNCDFIPRQIVSVGVRTSNILLRTEDEKKREAAKRREIREKELKEHDALMPVYLGSRDILLRREHLWPYEPGPHLILRAEEEREAAKRRELMGKELKEHNALMREDFWPYEPGPHLILWEDFWNIIRRAEEEREDPPAKRREIREKELKEEHNAFMREHLWIREHGPISHRSKSCPEKMRAASPASSCGSMRSARSMDFPFSFKRDEEEKREDPSAKRPEIRKLKLEEDRVVLIRERLGYHEHQPFISRQDFWPHDHGPNISSHVLRRKEQFLLHRAMVHDE